MSECCDLNNEELGQLRGQHRQALVIVLWINNGLFARHIRDNLISNITKSAKRLEIYKSIKPSTGIRSRL
jgi:hypothetical protein